MYPHGSQRGSAQPPQLIYQYPYGLQQRVLPVPVMQYQPTQPTRRETTGVDSGDAYGRRMAARARQETEQSAAERNRPREDRRSPSPVIPPRPNTPIVIRKPFVPARRVSSTAVAKNRDHQIWHPTEPPSPDESPVIPSRIPPADARRVIPSGIQAAVGRTPSVITQFPGASVKHQRRARQERTNYDVYKRVTEGHRDVAAAPAVLAGTNITGEEQPSEETDIPALRQQSPYKLVYQPRVLLKGKLHRLDREGFRGFNVGELLRDPSSKMKLGITRFQTPDAYMSWVFQWPGYNPETYSLAIGKDPTYQEVAVALSKCVRLFIRDREDLKLPDERKEWEAWRLGVPGGFTEDDIWITSIAWREEYTNHWVSHIWVKRR